jgi:ABC-type sulfate/molybdate transport systems ATPase subunit
VSLARGVSVNPQALVLDGPLDALDIHSTLEVRGFLVAYCTPYLRAIMPSVSFFFTLWLR